MLEVGRVYVVAGQGEMLLVGQCVLPSPVCVFLAHGRARYYAAPAQVVREATPEDLRRREEIARAKGVACVDPDCWCRRLGRDGLTLDQEIRELLASEPEGLTYPQIVARLACSPSKPAVLAALERLENEGGVVVESTDVSRRWFTQQRREGCHEV